MSDAALEALATAAGLYVHWRDAAGHPHVVSPESLRAVLSRMGVPCSSPAEVAEGHARLSIEAESANPPLLTALAGGAVDLNGPGELSGQLFVEGGGVVDVTLEETANGRRFIAPRTIGYHSLALDKKVRTIAVAPPAAFTVGEATPGRRPWGVAAQVYGLRGVQPGPFGDFNALAEAAATLGRAGADALAISPVHALFSADPSRYGPYAPSTRLFLNGLYADPSAIAGETITPESGEDELIDWTRAGGTRWKRLRAAFNRFKGGAPDEELAAFIAFREAGGPDLEGHARFEALDAVHGPGGWRAWPAAFQDVGSAAVAAFVEEHLREVEFHAFVQWLAARGLGGAQAAARGAGMAIGLIADLAVGMDSSGSHAWTRPQDLLSGLSVGAPPDIFQPAGQDWGLATFSPLALRRSGFDALLSTLRAAMRHAGGVRIDHAIGLRRLWLSPEGADSSQGAYLAYPMEDMVRLIALESRRNRAIVVGEDLGTVPETFREDTLSAGIMGMRVLWFEHAADHGFFAPRDWDPPAMAMTGTHDLPTVAGWWRGRDLDWLERLNRRGAHADVGVARHHRGEDRERLWRTATAVGLTDAQRPADEEPELAVDVALEFVAATPCSLAMIPVEDLLGLEEQPNLPGVVDGHPNWRRRLVAPLDELVEQPAVAARLERLRRARPK